jgi:uncharacterized membrane protein
VTVAAATLYIVFELGRQRHFLTNAYDLGIFDQAVRGYAHLGAPISVIKGVHNGFGTHFSVLGDHFSPILAVLAPFYRLFPHVQTLLVAQGVLFAASIPSVWLFSCRALGRSAAYPIAVGYALAWGLQAALADDFHEIAFAVALLAIAIERLDAGKLPAAIVAAALLLLVKEDLGLVVAAFGVVLGVRTRRWRLAAIVAAVALVATAVETQVLIPAAGGRAGYYWNYYAALGSNPVAALWHVLRHPVATWQLAVTPAPKLRLLEWLFLPLGLACLGSSLVLLAVPQLAELLFSSNHNQWLLGSHYSAIFAPILTMAAVDAVAKVRRLVSRGVTSDRLRVPRWSPGAIGFGYAAGLLVVAVWMCGRTSFGFDEFTQPWWSHTSADEVAAQAAIDAVPSGALVEASDHLVPHLTDRATVMLLDGTPHNAPWVVFDEGHQDWPLTPAQQAARPGWLISHGYQEVFAERQFVVYHRASSSM